MYEYKSGLLIPRESVNIGYILIFAKQITDSEKGRVFSKPRARVLQKLLSILMRHYAHKKDSPLRPLPLSSLQSFSLDRIEASDRITGDRKNCERVN